MKDLCCPKKKKSPGTCRPAGVPGASLTTFDDLFPGPTPTAAWTTIMLGTGGSITPLFPGIKLRTNPPGVGFAAVAIVKPDVSMNPATDDLCICFSAQQLNDLSPATGLNAGLVDPTDPTMQFLIVSLLGNVSIQWRNLGGQSGFASGFNIDDRFHNFSLCKTRGGVVTLAIDGKVKLQVPIDANFPAIDMSPAISGVTALPGAPLLDANVYRYTARYRNF